MNCLIIITLIIELSLLRKVGIYLSTDSVCMAKSKFLSQRNIQIRAVQRYFKIYFSRTANFCASLCEISRSKDASKKYIKYVKHSILYDIRTNETICPCKFHFANSIYEDTNSHKYPVVWSSLRDHHDAGQCVQV